MDPVGFAISVVGLVQIVTGLYTSIKRLQLNAARRRSLTTEVDRLVQVLGTAESTSDDAGKLVSTSVQEVKSALESLAESSRQRHCFPNCVSWCKATQEEADELDEAEQKLRSLTTQVVVVSSCLQLKESIFNERFELPQSRVGLDRSQQILDFLDASSSEQLRAIGIYGLPGVGKTTLLNYIWGEVSHTTPFGARAHVQVGDNATSQICSLQSSVLQQLGGEYTKFPSPEAGRQKLKEHFQKLRGNKKSVFLAIDNVYEGEDLEKLLPFDLSEHLPAHSCIAMTCRNIVVVKALLSKCCLEEESGSQVFCFSPPCLSLEASREVFASCGKLRMPEDAELLESLVPLCDGLPLALTVLGKLFAGNARRKRKECWEDIKKQMQVLDGDGAETRAITKSLRISFEQLPDSRKAAFLDVVQMFYGWPWGRVERILGKAVLNDLKDSSLIAEADDWTTCNQSALRTGFDMEGRWVELRGWRPHKVVTMHDLILRFGENHRLLLVTMERGFQSPSRGLPQIKLEIARTRNLIWSGDAETDAMSDILEKSTSLQTLILCKSEVAASNLYGWEDGYSFRREPIFRANYSASVSAAPYSWSWDGDTQPALRFLRLEGWQSSRATMEMKLSREIRELHLVDCQDVEQLPGIPLRQLEWLCIRDCKNFQGFSPTCVENWLTLKYLEVEGCPKLQSLPSLSSPLLMLKLSIPITHLDLEESACVCLRKVYLSGCDFEVLPSSMYSASSLEVLVVSRCKNLKGLSPAIGNASSLQELRVEACECLVELLDDVGKLTSLKKLNVKDCKSLKRLPGAIGNATSLEALSLQQCGSLVELPDEVGKLTSLKVLELLGCRNLKGLPPAIAANASSLRSLSLSGCDSMVELPDVVGKLTSLTSLRAWANSWKRLSPAVGNASALEVLDLSSCRFLEELPDEVGKLTSLRKLDMHACSSLKRLPSTIGNLAASLQTVILNECVSLEELPEEVGKLTSLIVLRVGECKSLKRIPPAIASLQSLQKLALPECERLEELADEVGKLTSLETLDMRGCKSLKRLPQSIGNLGSLRYLDLEGCEDLEGLPEEVGNLTSLRELYITGCKKLKGLPPSVVSLKGLFISTQGEQGSMRKKKKIKSILVLLRLPPWSLRFC